MIAFGIEIASSPEKDESSGGESVMKLEDDIEGSDGLAEGDKDFLKSLEKMAEELEVETDSPK